MKKIEKPIKILIINVHSTDNRGDAALLEMAIKCLRNVFPQSLVIIAANDADNLETNESKVGSFAYWMHRVSEKGTMRWQLLDTIKILAASLWALITYRLFGYPLFLGVQCAKKETIKTYFEADLVVSAPGNFLYSSGKIGLMFLVIAYTMGYALLAGKPLYLLPQSVGPLHRKRDQKLLKLILNHARIVMLRDPLSLNEVLNMGVNRSRCRLVPDLAFAYPSASPEEAVRCLRAWGIDVNTDRPLLGVTTINWGDRIGAEALQKRYEDALTEAVRYFLDRFGGRALFFAQVRSKALIDDDLITAKRIAARLGGDNRVWVVEEKLPSSLLKAIYGLMDVFIGTRMHSNIFALSQGVPVIAIAYFPKTRGIMQMLGLDRWVLDISTITPETLISRVIELWQEREELRSVIRRKVNGLIEEIPMVSQYIVSDFASLIGGHGEVSK